MKIALCIAGETRDYNTFFGPDTIITHLMENGHTVDIFGHTWNHCEKPVEDIFKFKRLLIEDQLKVIEDWVNGYPEKRQFAYWDHENDGYGPLEDIEVTRAKIGQHVSGWKSLQMPETNEYDLFLRWRWDLKLEWNQTWLTLPGQQKRDPSIQPHDKTLLESKIPVIKEMFNQWVDYVATKDDLPVILTDGHGWVGEYSWTIQDTHFFLNKSAHKNIKNTEWGPAIQKVWNETSKCSSHMLWNHLLIKAAKCVIRQSLPNATAFTSIERHNVNELYR
jgi:hypothetical protein